MSKNEDIIIKQVYELYIEFFNFEERLKHKPKNETQGYFIDKITLDKIKGIINYDSIMPIIRNKNKEDSVKNKIKKHSKYKEFKNNIIPKKFNNYKELIEELNNKKEYILINSNLCYKISKREKYYDKGIEFTFTEDSIVLIFNKKEKISFPIKNCIIENLIVFRKTENKMNIKTEIKFKEDLEILIRLYYFYKNIKNKENTAFNELKEENKETVYLIDNSWLEKYKSSFAYNELENYLNKDENNKTKNTFVSQELIQKIISNLPNNFINKIKKLEKNEKFNYEYNKLNLKNKNDIRYLVNFQIINSKIYELLLNLNYELNDSIKKVDLYFIGQNKILLLFENKIDNPQIGYINNENMFITEFLLKKEKDYFSLTNLNKFFLNDFINLILNKEKNSTQITD